MSHSVPGFTNLRTVERHGFTLDSRRRVRSQKFRIHPEDPNLVYLAALGNAFVPNEERGLFRFNDGGKTWQKSLYISSKTGVVDLAIDPANPRVLYAAAWTGERKRWTIVSGSEESGLYKKHGRR